MLRRGMVVVVLAVLGVLVSILGAPATRQAVVPSVPADAAPVTSPTTQGTQGTARAAKRPNVVLVLMDDASLELMKAFSVEPTLARRGARFTRSYVVDSLCCVSRTTLLTGQYPHQTGVRTNLANDPANPVGGWLAFSRYGNGARAVNVRLQRAGYRTAFMGKFLNEYNPKPGSVLTVPPGWSRFEPVFEGAYAGWNYRWGTSRQGGPLALKYVPAPPASASAAEKDRAYAGSLLQRRALRFIRKNRGRTQPYFLEVAVYAPHNRVGAAAYAGDPFFPPRFRDRPSAANPQGRCGPRACSRFTVADLPGYGDDRSDNRPRRTDGSPAPAWQRTTSMPRAVAEAELRDRARMVQSVNDLVRRVLKSVDDNTYVILTSDNGLHLGQWGFYRGKGTAYAADTQVPLYVVGPGVAPGRRTGFVTNLDLAPTLEHLAGLAPASYRSGTSLVPALRDPARSDGRYAFVEHTWSGERSGDPDAVDAELSTIPSYLAVRSKDGLLIRYDLDRRPGHHSIAWEFYDFRERKHEFTNTYRKARGTPLVKELRDRLREFRACKTHRRDDSVPQRCRDLTR